MISMQQITIFTSDDLKEARLCGMGKNTVRLEMNEKCFYINQKDYLEALLPDRPVLMFIPVAKTHKEVRFVFLNRIRFR